MAVNVASSFAADIENYIADKTLPLADLMAELSTASR